LGTESIVSKHPHLSHFCAVTMAKISGKADKKVTLYVIAGLVGTAVIGYGAFYLTGKGSGQSSAVAAPTQKPVSLGTTSEGGVAYNQTFQEKMLKTLNQAMDQMRTENSIRMDNFQREQQARDAERDARLQEQMDRERETQQAQVDNRMSSQVEPIKIQGTGTQDRRNAGDDGGFIGSPSDIKDQAIEATQAVVQTVTKKKDVLDLAVAPNGFIKGRTLNGVVAVVNAPAKPFLVKLQGQYRAANGYVMNLDGCVSYVEGRADLPSSRILGKPAKLTCNFAGGITKTWDVSGYVVDKDGIEGIVGVINDNSTKKLTGSAIGGGISLAGAALSRAQTQTYTSAAGTSSTMTGSIGSDVAGGLVQGAGTELGRQVTDLYNQYQSSVQVGGNRDITLVLLNELAVPDSGKDITTTRSASNSKGSQ